MEEIYGRHPVVEAFRAGRRKVHRLRVAEGSGVEEALSDVLARLSNPPPIERVPRSALDAVSSNHQGIAAHVDSYPYAELDQMIARAADSPPGLVLVLDLLQDPQNLGTLLRAAEGMGVHGVVLAKRRAVGVTPAVCASSAGACEHLLIARSNIASALRSLKAADFWIAGLHHGEGAVDLDQAKLSGALALVVGSEGEGLRRLVRESCDHLVRIPMRGKVESMNAATAGAIALYVARWGAVH